VTQSLRAHILALLSLSFLGACCLGAGNQSRKEPQTTAVNSGIPPAQKLPPAPQSTHYPILLLVEGSDQSWSLRIGLKGPERFDRKGYPPIPLDPAEVTRDGTADDWIYHAKDSQTGAAVLVHITRQTCADAPPDPTAKTKFAFTASVDHAQVGTLLGCARVATELFPKINNQPTEEDEEAKDKPPPATVTNFKSPVYVAYVGEPTDKMVVKRGTLAKTVPGKPGADLCLSHDGKKLLFVYGEEFEFRQGLSQYDFITGQTKELLRAKIRQAFWSPDDSQIAFLENVNDKWQLWTMPADNPERAAPIPYQANLLSLHGWVDAHTLLAGDLQILSWIGDDGSVKQTLSSAELYGKGQFGFSSANTVRVHPLNPDLLLVSAELAAPLPPAAPAPGSAKDAGSKEAPRKREALATQAFFLYEIRTKRRVILSSPSLTSSQAEWSRDGLQIYFTGRDPLGSAVTIYRVFWDGTSQTKYRDGRDFVIGE